MANYRRMISKILRLEGGLSDDPRDGASIDSWPGTKGKFGKQVHTNKGITKMCFCQIVPNLPLINGKKYVANWETFEAMPDELWEAIWKYGFWDVIQADLWQSQGVAEYVAHYLWGSGTYWPVVHLQRALNSIGSQLKEDGKFGPKTLGAVLGSNQRRLLMAIHTIRWNFLKSLPNANVYVGWFTALTDMYRTALVDIAADERKDPAHLSAAIMVNESYARIFTHDYNETA